LSDLEQFIFKYVLLILEAYGFQNYSKCMEQTAKKACK